MDLPTLFRPIMMTFFLGGFLACEDPAVDGPIITPPAPPVIESREVSVQLDPSVTYQTMQGFGGFGAQKVWWGSEPFFTPEFVDQMVNELGVTILRDNIPISFEHVNDNDDPNDLDLSAFNITSDVPGVDSHLGQHLPYLKAMKEAGVEKFISTVWSPPIWMKHNDHRGNGTNDQNSAPEYTETPGPTTNQLKLENYEEFAEYCIAYVKILKQEADIDLYALSVQNEPRFSQFYASCVHSFSSLKELIKVVGLRFEQEGIETKLFAPEDVQSIWHIRQYLEAIMNDPEAKRLTDIFAIHNYRNNGIDPSDEGPTCWQETYQLAKQAEKEVWMTETSGFDALRMDGGLELAKSMYNAIEYGNASAWVYWQMSEGGNQAFLQDGKRTFLYHVSRHFYRHIRPGFQRIGVTDEDDDLLCLAFTQEEKLVIVMVNTGDKELSISLNGPMTDKSLELIQTTADEPYVSKGEVKLATGISLPPHSLITLTE